MVTPFVENTFCLGEDRQGRKTASFYIDPWLCRNVCARCAIREWKDQPYKLMEEDMFYRELARYSLFKVGLINIRGGDISNKGLLRADGMPLEELLPVVRQVAPVCIWTNGSNTDAVESLIPYVDGFRIDIKVPLFGKVSRRSKTLWERALGFNKGVDTYVKAVKNTINKVDGMAETYYTSSSWRDMDAANRELMLDAMAEYESPFIVE